MAKERKEPLMTLARSEMKSKKAQKSKISTHPPYFQMIKEALMVLKEKNGSSPYAIAKYIEEKYKSLLPHSFRKTLSLQLKNSVSKGKLVKIRASYKLLETNMKETRERRKKEEKKKKQEEVESKKTRSSSRRSRNTLEVAAKKKRKPKKLRQLKSIKSPAARKVLIASAK